ncbi:unnamed protein product [Lactuca virosa]|uniref:Uncharacterized protein n=1 Tax=Lactuca virosa TaxID=75947 RepID=A0AAU9MMU9_9ASTR|nr:unnamed protein product [Lactuca virosa]
MLGHLGQLIPTVALLFYSRTWHIDTSRTKVPKAIERRFQRQSWVFQPFSVIKGNFGIQDSLTDSILDSKRKITSVYQIRQLQVEQADGMLACFRGTVEIVSMLTGGRGVVVLRSVKQVII